MNTAGRILPATPDSIAEAARIIRDGGLVAFPTETVYGLGADATNDRAVAGIFAAKDRPRFNPLIVHFPDADAAAAMVAFNAVASQLAERFWPGALTLVLQRRPDCPVSLLASAGLDTLAVRVPDHNIARALLDAAGCPVVAPSANRTGAVSPTAAAHVAQSLGARVDLILDGGPCPIGIESTVIDLAAARPTLLRPGGLAPEDLEILIGPLVEPDSTMPSAPVSPGMLASHYAPSLPLRFGAKDIRPGEALLSFGGHRLTGFAAERNLSPSGDLAEAAANLFRMLRELDRPEFTGIAAMTVPETGLGRAINDRLHRAAAPRQPGSG